MLRLTQLSILLSMLCLPGLLYGGTVTFVAGSVFIKDGGKQAPAKAGEKFSNSAILVSKKKGMLKVKQSNTQITLKFPGSYSAANLLKAAKASKKGSNLLAMALKDQASQPVPAVAAGTRASDPTQQMGSFTLGQMTTGLPRDEVQNLLKEGKYYKIRNSIIDPVDGYEAFALGFALSQLGEKNAAIQHLIRAIKEAETADIRGRAASTLSFQYLEEGDYYKSYKVVARFKKTHSLSETPAEVFYVHSVSAGVIGKTAESEASATNLKRLYPGSILASIVE